MRYLGLLLGLCSPALGPVGAAQENVMRAPMATPTPSARAAAGATGANFADIAAFDLKVMVPAPPAPDTLAAAADLEAVLQVQAWRTSDQVAWAKLVEADHVFNHAAVLGTWFTSERLPLAAQLFQAIGNELKSLDALAKKPFLRPRPSAVDARVQPCVSVPASTSYPSGSAMQAFVWAELLAEAIPARRGELFVRAHRAAWGRVIGGVHFPSDVVAGRMLAETYLAACRNNPAFRAAWEAVRVELVETNERRRP